jgi:hypothetical protein
MTFYCDCGCPEGRGLQLPKEATADISYETLKEIEANFIEGENQIPECSEIQGPPETMSALCKLAGVPEGTYMYHASTETGKGIVHECESFNGVLPCLTCEACYAPKADCKCYEK